MDTHFHQTGLLVASVRAESGRAEPDEERMGHPVVLPAGRDRLMLQVGKMMIVMGEKLTEISMRDDRLSQDMA